MPMPEKKDRISSLDGQATVKVGWREDADRKPPEEDAVIFRPIARTGKGFVFTVIALLAIVLWGAYAYSCQLQHGLGVTGMNRPIFWGIYIASFVFFIGISHAGTLISAILRVCHAEWRRPVTRIAEAITVFALFIGASQVIIDLGHPERILNIVEHGRFQSPLIWDVVCISTYLIASITYLYLPLIPDLALCRDRLTTASQFKKRLYRTLSLGWTGTETQKRRLNYAIAVMAVAIIPIAISVHTVVSWIFAMTIQPMWHSTIFGPYFVVGAIFSGIASLIIAMAIIRKVFHLEAYIKPLHFNNLGLLLLTMNALWFYFTFAEYLTTFYGDEPHEMVVFTSKLNGEFAPFFWVMIALMTSAFLLLAIKKTRTITGVLVASVFINIGMWLERFTIVVPSLSRPRLPYQWGVYSPTWVEWSILGGSVAAFILLYVLFSKIFPIVSVWEIQEGRDEGIQTIVKKFKSYQPEAIMEKNTA